MISYRANVDRAAGATMFLDLKLTEETMINL